MRTLLSVTFAVLASAASAQEPVALLDGEISAVQNGIRSTLKDPESARFGPIKAAIHDDGIYWVCGLVNAKNAFGGYSGEQPFVGVLASLRSAGRAEFIVKGFGDSDSKREQIISFCSERGIR